MTNWRIGFNGASMGSMGFNGSGTLCPNNVNRVREITVGFWQDIYKGGLGGARVSVQYVYVTLHLFASSAVASAATNPNSNAGLRPSNSIVTIMIAARTTH